MNRLETANSRSASRGRFAFAALMALCCLFAQSLVTTALADKKPKDFGLVKITVPIHDPVKNPDGYTLLVNGEDWGNTTPIQRTLELASGKTHRIEVVFSEDKRWVREIFINAGRIYCVGVQYSPFTPPEIIEPCPPCSVTLETTSEVKRGDPVTVDANVAFKGARENITYTWTVSPGNVRIASGGGPNDSSVTFDTTGLGENKLQINLAVDTGAFSSDQKKCNCENAVASVDIAFEEPDRFQFVAYDELKARLDNLVIDLQRYKDATAYIIYYTGENCGTDLNSRLGDRSREYLINERGFDPNRLKVISGGRSTIDWMEIHVVPLGGAEPTPNPGAAPAARPDLRNRCMQDVTTQQPPPRPSRRRSRR